MKSKRKSFWTASLGAVVLLGFMSSAYSDEGMWLYDDPPMEILKEKYDFAPSADWLTHLQMSSVRFNNGGSGSFVSEDGLVISNHHVGADALGKLSTKERDLMRNGFYAATLKDELPCYDLELNVLVSIEDVTDKVSAAVKAEMSAEEAAKARRAVMARLEQESLDATGLRSDVVTLFQGGKYSLYRYKRYTDVRLVFAPEEQIGFFGGDPDNFEYPRYNLDISLFRVYEDGKPAKVPHHLVWSEKGVADGDLVLVSGHPGSTSRLLTCAEVDSERDLVLPTVLNRYNRLEVLCSAWANRDKENARWARNLLHGVQNGRKAFTGRYAGLLDPSFIAKKRAEEAALKQAMQKSNEFRSSVTAFDVIAKQERAVRGYYAEYRMWERAQAFNSQYFRMARTLLRNADEKGKASEERLREFRDSNRQSLELGLFSEAPVSDEFEMLLLTDSLKYAVETLGYNNALVQRVLIHKSPEERASELILQTKVKDVSFRKKAYAMSSEELAALKDPMIELARLVDARSREIRKKAEETTEIVQQAHDQLAKARFALMSEHSYPDATFTLRLSFGSVCGYELGGVKIPFETTIGGMYDHAKSHDYVMPFDLPQTWKEAEEKVDKSRSCNFVCTADIIGGNSGSPVVNRDGEFVGIIFDGNLESLVLDYGYTEKIARATSVSASFIEEGLSKVYGADKLLSEIKSGHLSDR